MGTTFPSSDISSGKNALLKTFFNETDGHTYIKTGDGKLIAYPTFADGCPDYENGVYVDDFDIRLQLDELAQINSQL
jgi:hypothetical protein